MVRNGLTVVLLPIQFICFWFVHQGIVIGTGESSEFGEVFKMMQAEEVQYVLIECSCDPCLYKYLCVTSWAELVVKNL